MTNCTLLDVIQTIRMLKYSYWLSFLNWGGVLLYNDKHNVIFAVQNAKPRGPMYSSPLKRKRDDPSGGQPISRETALPYAPRESQLSKYLVV